VGKPEGKRPLGRPRRRWVDNIQMDLGEMGWSSSGYEQMESSCEFGIEPLDSIKCWKLWNGFTICGLSSSA
jgi:hypothetical protein